MTSLLSPHRAFAGRVRGPTTLAVLARADRPHRRRGRRRRRVQGRLHRPGHRVPAAQDLLEQRFAAQSGTQATLVFSAQHGAVRPSARSARRSPRSDSPTWSRSRIRHARRVSDDGRTAYATVSYDQTATDLDAKARDRLEDATAGLPGRRDVAMSGEPIDGAATGGFPSASWSGSRSPAAAARRAAQPARGAQRAGRRLRRHRARLRRADVGGGRDRRARPRADAGRHARARRRHRLRAAARRPPAGGTAGRRTPVEAAQRANATAGHSALTAAGSCSSRSPGCWSPASRSSGRAGVAAGLVVLACAIVCVVLLPARFATAGRKLLPRRERAAARARVAPRAPWATKRPVLALLAAGAVTVALAAPAAGLELGQPDDRNLTADTTQRQAYDRLAEGFGAGVNGPLVVAVSLPDRGAGPVAAAPDEGSRADPEVADVARPALNPARDTAVITVTPKHGPQDERPARSWTGSARRHPRRAAATRARPPTSAAAPPASATRPRRSPRGSRCSPPRSSACRCCSCSPPSARGGSRVLSAAVQPGLDRRRLRRRDARVPDRDRRLAARRRAAARRALRAAVHVRDPVRALDGLQRVPALAGPRGMGPARRATARRSRRPRPARARSSPRRARS